MRNLVRALCVGGVFSGFGVAIADNHDSDADEANVASPIELFTCKYNEGKGPGDLAAATKRFNAWADKNDVTDYSAWTLTPYYASSNQEFDVIWLGASPSAKALGRVQDSWITSGTREQQGFDEVVSCDTHAGFSALQIKAPPTRDNPSNIVISFSDCNTMNDTTFGDLYMPLIEWGEYMGEHGSKAGMWILFPNYGGGAEEFDFKYIDAFQNLEDMGADWDHVNKSGWEKANELFEGKVKCDSARTYLATNHRMAEDDE